MADEGRWYAIVDGARDSRLHNLILRSREADCLFSGEVAPELAAASPHLVAFDPREPLFELWQKEGGGRHWGIFAQSALPFDGVRRQCKKLLNVVLPDGQVVLFRFWDPRVFTPFVTACSDAERTALFAGITMYMVDGQDGQRRRYRLHQGALQVA